MGSESGFPTGITSGGFSPASIYWWRLIDSHNEHDNERHSLCPFAHDHRHRRNDHSHRLDHVAGKSRSAGKPHRDAGGAGQISLSWPASVAATSYHVKRALVSGGPYTTVGCTTTTSYTDSGRSQRNNLLLRRVGRLQRES